MWPPGGRTGHGRSEVWYMVGTNLALPSQECKKQSLKNDATELQSEVETGPQSGGHSPSPGTCLSLEVPRAQQGQGRGQGRGLWEGPVIWGGCSEMTPGSPPVGVFMPELQHAGTVSVLELSPIYYVIQQMHLYVPGAA